MPMLYEAVAAELKRRDVSAAFGLLGEDIVSLGAELDRVGISYYAARHEATAVQMADGYARASGRLGVALISRGPGFTNALTSIAIAARARSRVLIITTEPDPALRGKPYSKWVDQPLLLDGIEADGVTLLDAETAAADFAAICDAVACRGPIVASFRGDVLDRPAGSSPTGLTLDATPPPQPDPEEITYLADLLSESWAFRHPLILAGRGAVHSGAGPELVRIGRSCGALLGTTLMAESLFAGEDFEIGVCGSLANDLANEVLQEADAVLAFGASLNTFTTLKGSMFPKAKVFQIDADAAASERSSVPVDLFMHADAGLAARALADELERRSHHAVGFRSEEIARKIATHSERPIDDEGQPGAVDPRIVAQRLEEMLPREKVLIPDGGYAPFLASRELSVTRARDALVPMQFYSIGISLGFALGAAIANPDRPTVCVVGDAGLLMQLAEIETAARYGLKLLVLVANDSALGSEIHVLRHFGLPDEIARHTTPSFEDVGKALGCGGFTIRDLADVDQLAERVAALDGPLVVDILSTTLPSEGAVTPSMAATT